MLKGFPVFDVDQVEVLRGPQGTLFGRNSPAGVIKFDSAKPVFKTEGYLQRRLRQVWHARTLEGAFNVPVSDTVAAARLLPDAAPRRPRAQPAPDRHARLRRL